MNFNSSVSSIIKLTVPIMMETYNNVIKDMLIGHAIIIRKHNNVMNYLNVVNLLMPQHVINNIFVIHIQPLPA